MNELQHHGILGQKWGIRRFQNKDGSLTAAGRKRYSSKEIADFDASLERYSRVNKKLGNDAWKHSSKEYDEVLKKADNIFLKADPELNNKCEAYVKAHIKFSNMEEEVTEKYYKLNGYKGYNDFRENEPDTWDSEKFQTYLAHYPGWIKNYQEDERAYKEFIQSLNSSVDKALGDIGNEPINDRYGSTWTKTQEVFRLIKRLQEKRYMDEKYGETMFSPYTVKK